MVSNRPIPAGTSTVPKPSSTTSTREVALRTEPIRQRLHRPPFRPFIVFDNKIVFNFFRAEDPRIREVVSMRDIVVDGKGLSWEKLVEILSARQCNEKSVFDEEKDMMFFDRRICVQDERQFIAAVQWISNMEDSIRNVHVPIHDAGMGTRSKLWPKGE